MATPACTFGRRSHLEFMPFIPTTIEYERFTTLRIDKATIVSSVKEPFYPSELAAFFLSVALQEGTIPA